MSTIDINSHTQKQAHTAIDALFNDPKPIYRNLSREVKYSFHTFGGNLLPEQLAWSAKRGEPRYFLNLTFTKNNLPGEILHTSAVSGNVRA